MANEKKVVKSKQWRYWTTLSAKIVYLILKFTSRIFCSCCKRSELSPGFFCCLKAPCWLNKKNFRVSRLVNVFWCLWYEKSWAGSRPSSASPPSVTISSGSHTKLAALYSATKSLQSSCTAKLQLFSSLLEAKQQLHSSCSGMQKRCAAFEGSLKLSAAVFQRSCRLSNAK